MRIVRSVGAQVHRLWSLASASSIVPDSEDGRARERHRRMVLSAMAGTLAKAISIIATLVSVPLTLHYLGLERYGMWMTMTSLFALLAFADLGIGNGLLSAIAEAHGRQDRQEIRELVSSGVFALSAIGAVLLLCFWLLYPFVEWYRLFNVHTVRAREEAGPAVAVMATCFAAAIPGAVVQRVQAGLQCGFVASLWQAAASALGLISLIAAIQMEAGLPWLALSLLAPPLVFSLVNGVFFFGRTERNIAPQVKSVTKKACRRLSTTGALFLVLQIVASLTYASDPLIIAHSLGAEAVAAYAVPEKMFSLVAALLALAMVPLWPAYGEAKASGDHEWIRKTFRRSLVMSMGVAAFASIVLVALGPWLISKWVSNAISPSLLLLIALGVWKTIEAGGNSVAMYLNGAGIVRFQVIVAIVTAAVGVGLKFVLVERIGVSGPVWASVMAYLVFAALPMYLLLRRGLRVGK